MNINKEELGFLIAIDDFDLFVKKLSNSYDEIDSIMFHITFSHSYSNKNYFHFEGIEKPQEIPVKNGLKKRDLTWPCFFYSIFFNCSNQMLKFLLSHTKNLNYIDECGIDAKKLIIRSQKLDYFHIFDSFLYSEFPTPNYKFRRIENLDKKDLKMIKMLKGGLYFVSGLLRGCFLDEKFRPLDMVLTERKVKKLIEYKNEWIMLTDKFEKIDPKTQEITNLKINIKDPHNLNEFYLYEDLLFLLFYDNYIVYDLKTHKYEQYTMKNGCKCVFYLNYFIVFYYNVFGIRYDIWFQKEKTEKFTFNEISTIDSIINLGYKFLLFSSNNQHCFYLIDLVEKNYFEMSIIEKISFQGNNFLYPINERSFFSFNESEISLWNFNYQKNTSCLKKINTFRVPILFFNIIESLYIEDNKLYIIDDESRLYIYEMGGQIPSFQGIHFQDLNFRFQ